MGLIRPKGMIENDENPCGYEYSEYSALCNGRQPHICGDDVREACKLRHSAPTAKKVEK